MSWTSLFITDANSQETVTPKPSETKKPTTSFPTSGQNSQTGAASFPTNNGNFQQNGSSFQVNAPTAQPSGNRFINDIVGVYDKNFKKINSTGYDFFEFFKMVNKGGIDNPQVYGMALEMAQSVDSSVTKDSLVTQSGQYIAQLEALHTSVSEDGTRKLTELTTNKSNETASLTTDIGSLSSQLQLITQQLNERQHSLSEIDSKYQPKIDEISEKLSANDTARNMIVSNINKVKNNIQTI